MEDEYVFDNEVEQRMDEDEKQRVIGEVEDLMEKTMQQDDVVVKQKLHRSQKGLESKGVLIDDTVKLEIDEMYGEYRRKK